MGKRIAYCADGTWDDPQSDTNVSLLYNALTLTPHVQYPIYGKGVGADGRPIQRLLGGAFGTGLFQLIKDAYTRIALSFDAGDELFLFGFSRGAYTARSLAGMLALVGLPTKPFNDSMVDTAFQAYRDKSRRAALIATLEPYGMVKATIKMLGVWDTVGSLGIPALLGDVDPILYGFLDTTLHPDVQHAYQALAIDERRGEFPPTLWAGDPAPGQTIEQVWFCGVHSDVGGSYPETSLSDITLGWMMSKASAFGLQFDNSVYAHYANLDAKHALGPLHDSWNPIWGFPRRRTIAANATLSSSVGIRCSAIAAYRPENLTFADGLLAAAYQTLQTVTAPVTGANA